METQSLNCNEDKIKETIEDLNSQINSLNQRKLECLKLNEKIIRNQKLKEKELISKI